jgi:predicted amidohydrolase YtcJ
MILVMMNKINEKLFINTQILTMVDQKIENSMLIRNNQIIAVGTEEHCLKNSLTKPEVINLDAQTVMPGFVDAHCHPLMHGQFKSWIDCGWESAAGIEDVISILKLMGKKQNHSVIRGKGFHHGNVKEKRMLNCRDLDRVSTTKPVVVFHSSGHGAIVNSVALLEYGVDKDTKDPEGGHFGHFEDGRPNGEVWDSAADALTGKYGVKITNNGPNFHVSDDFELLDNCFEDAQEEFLSVGVTTIVDAQVSKREMLSYLRVRDKNKLKFRVRALFISSLLDSLEEIGLGSWLGDEKLAAVGIKIYSDGALTGATARFSEPYCCSKNDFGFFYHDPSELSQIIERAIDLGLQTATHAQGDAGIQIVIDALEKVSKSRNIQNARHRIEHCGAPTKEQIKKISMLGIWPVTQPQYVYRYGDELVRVLGKRAERLIPLREFQDAKISLVLSSDAPVCPPLPLEAVFSASSRKTLNGDFLGADQSISVWDALRAHTVGAASSIHMENKVGSIKPGLLADFIVLDKNPLVVKDEEILEVNVNQTWIDGQLVFARR